MAANLWPYQSQFPWTSTLDGTLTDQSRLWLDRLQRQVATGGLGVQIGGDIGGTNTVPSVIGLQGRKLSGTAPADGQVLTWVNANSDWEPKALPPGYVLPPATATVLGGVKIGANVTAQADGTISVPPAQVNSDWNASTGVAQILNKPAIPAAQVNSDWAAVSGVAMILNKPAIPNGTVTSVGLSAPSEFTVSNSPVTASGTLTFTKANQSANLVYAGPSTGAAAAPAFRALVAGDLPAGAGSVTSVGLAMPAEFTVSGSPVTSAGTLTATKANQAANTVYAGPATGSAAPTFRALGAADIPQVIKVNGTPVGV